MCNLIENVKLVSLGFLCLKPWIDTDAHFFKWHVDVIVFITNVKCDRQKIDKKQHF